MMDDTGTRPGTDGSKRPGTDGSKQTETDGSRPTRATRRRMLQAAGGTLAVGVIPGRGLAQASGPTVYIGQGGFDPKGVYALDAGTGEEVWSFDTSESFGSSPTVVESPTDGDSVDSRVNLGTLGHHDGWTGEASTKPPLPGFDNPPQDLDGDGLYEDVDGDGWGAKRACRDSHRVALLRTVLVWGDPTTKPRQREGQRRMATADKQIRVSDQVKRLLDRRRREGESYNDVLERLLAEENERDLLAGFGRWSDEHADRIRDARETQREKSKERMHRLAENE